VKIPHAFSEPFASPAPEDVEAFVKDESPETVEKIVDKLLASQQFGERWGRYWLDLARYAESNGNADNTPFPEAWRYRDYVIRSINADKPYDQFVREQVANCVTPIHFQTGEVVSSGVGSVHDRNRVAGVRRSCGVAELPPAPPLRTAIPEP